MTPPEPIVNFVHDGLTFVGHPTQDKLRTWFVKWKGRDVAILSEEKVHATINTSECDDNTLVKLLRIPPDRACTWANEQYESSRVKR